MFRDKIAHGLIELLEPKGLVRPVNDYEVEFDASIGGLYMLFLARRMAKHQPIVSDDPIYEALTNMATQPDTIDVAADRGFLLANAIFTSAVPIDIESVDIRDLISSGRISRASGSPFMNGSQALVQTLPRSKIRSNYSRPSNTMPR